MTSGITLHVAATIAGSNEIKVDSYRKYSKEVKERINTLGLQALLDADTLEASQQIDILERCVWKLASKVKGRRIGLKSKDFINALNFLEAFCLYAGQSNLATGRNMKAIEKKIDKTVMKAVKEIEYINKLFESGMKKRGKVALKKHVDTLNLLVDKILTRNLTQTEQIAMGKIVDKAEKILSKI